MEDSFVRKGDTLWMTQGGEKADGGKKIMEGASEPRRQHRIAPLDKCQ